MAMLYAAYPNVNPQNVMGRSRRGPQRPTGGGTVTPTPSTPTAPTAPRGELRGRARFARPGSNRPATGNTGVVPPTTRKTPVSPSRPNGPIYGGLPNKYALLARKNG